MTQYHLWAQVAGYFDGDGTIAISDTSNQPYKLSLSLIFVDQSWDQIKTVKSFLESQRVRTSNILNASGNANLVAVSEFNSVLKMLKLIYPFLCKKQVEAKAAIDYYEGRITGNRLLQVFGDEVNAGRRERHPRKVAINVPYLRPEGDRLMREKRSFGIRDAMGRYRAKVSPEDYRSIRVEHFQKGKRLCELVKEYPYARETIRRVLGGGRGYVLVKGWGIVKADNR
ncbi:MAG: hypothetical protein HY297_00090 [Thaumarchaeota archaeon]|nr:hypothetical protein [Nitrososphaerota archaeon]